MRTPDLLPAPAVDALLAVDGGHGHVLSFGSGIGPLVLRVALLVAVSVVVAFALLRGFLTEPRHSTTFPVASTAGGAVVVELLLSGGLNLPEQVVPLLLAALALPLYLLRSTDPRFAPVVGRLRALAPWVFGLAGVLAVLEFARTWSGATATEAGLHTGVVLALLALAWYAVARTPGRRVVAFGVQTAAAVLAVALLAGAASVVVLRDQGPGGRDDRSAGAECAGRPCPAR